MSATTIPTDTVSDTVLNISSQNWDEFWFLPKATVLIGGWRAAREWRVLVTFLLSQTDSVATTLIEGLQNAIRLHIYCDWTDLRQFHLLAGNFACSQLLDEGEAEPRVEEAGKHVLRQEVQGLLRLNLNLRGRAPRVSDRSFFRQSATVREHAV